MSKNDTAVDLGARVRQLRRERGLTLKALGGEAGLSHPFLSQLERGLARPSVGSVERIAHALGVPVTALWARRCRAPARITRAGEGSLTPHPERGVPGGVRVLPGDDSALHVCEWSGGSRSWPAGMETVAGELLVYVARGSGRGRPRRHRARARRGRRAALRRQRAAPHPPPRRRGHARTHRVADLSRWIAPPGRWGELEDSIRQSARAASRNGAAGLRPGSASHTSVVRRGSRSKSASPLRGS